MSRTRARRPSPQTVAVLRALAGQPSVWRHGYELGQEVGIKAGSLYPILIRLTDRGLLEAAWEPEPAPGRPLRHLYRLTEAGASFAAAAESMEAVDATVGAGEIARTRSERATEGRATKGGLAATAARDEYGQPGRSRSSHARRGAKPRSAW